MPPSCFRAVSTDLFVCPIRPAVPQTCNRPSTPSPASSCAMSTDAYRQRDGLHVAIGDDGVLRLTLSRPEKRNALDDTMVQGLIGAIDAAGRDEAVRAIFLTGA